MKEYLTLIEELKLSIEWKNKEDYKLTIGKIIHLLEKLANKQNLTLKECYKASKE